MSELEYARDLLSNFGLSHRKLAAIAPGTSLVRDLKIDGDDLEELIELAAREYGCDFARFNIEDYGRDEGQFGFPSNLILWLGTRAGFYPEKASLTVQMLDEALKRGKW